MNADFETQEWLKIIVKNFKTILKVFCATVLKQMINLEPMGLLCFLRNEYIIGRISLLLLTWVSIVLQKAVLTFTIHFLASKAYEYVLLVVPPLRLSSDQGPLR